MVSAPIGSPSEIGVEHCKFCSTAQWAVSCNAKTRHSIDYPCEAHEPKASTAELVARRPCGGGYRRKAGAKRLRGCLLMCKTRLGNTPLHLAMLGDFPLRGDSKWR